ncbi:mitofilin family membrane protein [Tepidicaulis sp.]|uniref:mitofilin family membrane protein n=1 Tax=Tepidicaulis sp. TaxID=1920809 RepID=UPI003B5AF800
MSDETDKGGPQDKAQKGGASGDPEILRPGQKAKAGSKRREDDPRIIEGEAEEVREDEAARGEGSSKAPPSPSSNGASGTLGPVLAAGLGGGLIGAVALGAFLHFSGALPGAFEGDGDRLASVESRLAAAMDFTRSETSRLGTQMSRFEEDLGALEPERVTGIEENLSALQQEARKVESRLAAIDSRFEEVAATRDARLAELKAGIADLQGQLDALRLQLPPADLAANVGANDRRLDALETGIGALGPQVADLSGKLSVLTEKVNEPSGAEKAALGTALAGLARAFESGQPFASELEAIKAVTGERPDIEALAEAAEKGVPSLATLKQRFPDLAGRVLHAEKTEGADGLWEKLAANASALVTVRLQGDVEGTSTEAVLARMEQRLGEDNLKGAVEAGQALSGPAGEAAAPWLQAAEARVRGEALIGALQTAVMASIAAENG